MAGALYSAYERVLENFYDPPFAKIWRKGGAPAHPPFLHSANNCWNSQVGLAGMGGFLSSNHSLKTPAPEKASNGKEEGALCRRVPFAEKVPPALGAELSAQQPFCHCWR